MLIYLGGRCQAPAFPSICVNIMHILKDDACLFGVEEVLGKVLYGQPHPEQRVWMNTAEHNRHKRLIAQHNQG